MSPDTENKSLRQTPDGAQLTGIKVIAFDADDTLWVNETFFRETEFRFCDLMKDFADSERAFEVLFETESQNMRLYGYGIKPFTLSLIEAAIKLSDGRVSIETIGQLISGGKEMLENPVKLLPGIEEALEELSARYRLVMVTKGDLLDQERKLTKSGLEPYFHHIEIVSDKTPRHYLKLVKHLDIQPEEFLMVGNSPKSDVLPVLEIGAHAFHVPFHTTWIHEQVEHDTNHPRFKSFERVEDILQYL
jgi:putative hydrolase of the HAD superfamily